MDFDSILNLYKKTYFNLPRGVRNYLGTLYGSIPLEIRFGKEYKIHKEILEEFENANDQFKYDYMFNKTYETLQFAYDNISHYTKKFNEHGFKPEDFKSLEDINKVPYLTKKMIQNNLDNLYTDKIDKPVAIYTGGSTFTPTKFYVSSRETRAKERAYTSYIFGQLGYKYRDKTLVLREKDTSDEKNNIYWDYEKVANQLRLSANHINSKNIKKMVEEVNLFRPKYIHGYPSAISLFINECKKIGVHNISGVSGIFFTSELIFPEQVKKTSLFFNCKVLSHFGHSEATAVGYRLNNEPYHFLNSYGLTRVINNELVTTSFDNFVMPFINYKTQDYVMEKITFINNSDIISSVEDIEGRLQEYVVTKDGTLRTVMSIGMGHFDTFQYVDAAQYHQKIPGKLTIWIESQFPEKVQVKEIINSMEEEVKHTIEFDVKFVEKIEKTSRGKWRTCIQELNIEKYK